MTQETNLPPSPPGRFFAVLAFLTAVCAGGAAAAVELVETPSLAPLVASGKLPPIAQRVPAMPAVVPAATTNAGEPRMGGDMRVLMSRSQDVRMMVVYGYARLVAFNPALELVPDLLAGIDIADDKVFTFHLRPGHRWSDGRPFTADDFRYYWQDVALDPMISPVGPPAQMLVNGERPRFEVIDPTTVRFTWSRPNPTFLTALAGATPLYIYRPAHYLRQFHAKYADQQKLDAEVKKAAVRNWAALHNRMDNQYRNDNPDLPTLDPWMITTPLPADRFVFLRNPYYHRVDSAGRQLPYIDRVVMNVADTKIIPAKTGAGEADLQARYLTFKDYTFLKQAARRSALNVRLWDTARGADLALYPNINVNDPGWRTLLRDVRFRRALSLSIDRHEINEVIYSGLAVEGGNTVLPQSPLNKADYRTSWSTFDLKQANALLDEIGLTRRNAAGIRLLPDGRPLEIIVETAGENSDEVDVLELVGESWKKAGIKLFTKPSQREVLRNRVFAGDTVMSIWFGYENGIPTADMSPWEFVPTTQAQLHWPKWGQYVETSGAGGEPIDMEPVRELARLGDSWRGAGTKEQRAEIWRRILGIHADQVYTIGLIGGVMQPVVINAGLQGVPERGIYNFDPGAHFGMYRPDTFWWAKPN